MFGLGVWTAATWKRSSHATTSETALRQFELSSMDQGPACAWAASCKRQGADTWEPPRSDPKPIGSHSACHGDHVLYSGCCVAAALLVYHRFETAKVRQGRYQIQINSLYFHVISSLDGLFIMFIKFCHWCRQKVALWHRNHWPGSLP